MLYVLIKIEENSDFLNSPNLNLSVSFLSFNFCNFIKFSIKNRIPRFNNNQNSIDDIDEFIRAKIEAFSDDVRQYGFGPTGYDDYEKEKS